MSVIGSSLFIFYRETWELWRAGKVEPVDQG